MLELLAAAHAVVSPSNRPNANKDPKSGAADANKLSVSLGDATADDGTGLPAVPLPPASLHKRSRSRSRSNSHFEDFYAPSVGADAHLHASLGPHLHVHVQPQHTHQQGTSHQHAPEYGRARIDSVSKSLHSVLEPMANVPSHPASASHGSSGSGTVSAATVSTGSSASAFPEASPGREIAFAGLQALAGSTISV
jgi:hypothetical protein